MKSKTAIAVLFSLFAAVCAPSKILRGGGVNLCKSALLRAFLALSAALFSAGFNISANAQVMTEATADVYQRPTLVRFGVDFSDPIPTIIEDVRTASQTNLGNDFGIAGNLLIRENADDTGSETVDTDNLGPNGLLQFGLSGSRREMRLGDRFLLISGGVPVATIYMYTATGGEFAFAENTGNPAATTGTGEFFLDANFAETTEITAAMGFTEVQCAATFISNDRITCECPTEQIEQSGMCVSATPTLTCDAASTTGQNGDRCTCRDGYTERVSPEMCRMPTTPQTQTSGGESEDSKAAKVIGVVGIGMAVFVIANGGLFSDAFAFAPDFGYSLTESGYAANIGGRADFRKDNWHLYQSADSDFHRNGSLDFRYTSGGKYKGDLFSASFSESISGETADYNFALSANWTGGIWKISPVYRLHSEYEKGEFNTRNSLNLQSEFRHNGWQIRPSAGFRWENADNFAENARFRIDAVHRF